MKKFILLTLIFITWIAQGQSSDSEPWITGEEYKESVEGKDYYEANLEESKAEKRNIQPPLYTELITNIIAVLAILLLVGLVAYFVVISIKKKSLNTQNTNKSRIKALSLRDAEENLDMRDLSHLIAKAELDKDFKLLIRLHYLSTLQYLNDHKFIVWKIQKTDFHYLTEVKKQEFHLSFFQLITIFQNTWYGLTIPEEDDVKAALFFINRVKNKSINE